MSAGTATAPSATARHRISDRLLRPTIQGRDAVRIFAVLVALVALLFWPTLANLAQVWWDDPGYSHGFLVLPLTGWLVYRWFRENRPRFVPEPALGTLEVSAGVLIHWAALVLGWPLVDFVGLFLCLRGLALALHGRPCADGLTVPLAFLFFMFPLPGIVMASSALWLQDFVARASGLVLEQIWVVRQRGHAIELPGMAAPLVVGAECSGLRQLISLLAMSALLAHLGLKRWWSTIVLMLATVPVAILANVARVIAMVVAAKWFGTAWIDTWLHSAPALFTFPVAIGLLLLFTWALQRLETLSQAEGESPRRAEGVSPPVKPAEGVSPAVNQAANAARSPSRPSLRGNETASDAGPRRAEGVSPPMKPAEGVSPPVGPLTLRLSPLGVLGGTGAVFLGVVVQALLLWHLEAGAVRRGPTLPVPLDRLPEQLGTWQAGERADIAKLRERITFADDLFLRQYVEPQARLGANLYLVYSAAGKDREHHPEICMNEVAGMPDLRDRRRVVFLNQSSQRPVQRFEYPAGTERRLYVWYWHYTVEPPLREGQTLLQALHQRLSRRPASLTVQITATGSEQTAEQVERSLLPEIDGFLRKAVLPEYVVMGCDRVQVRWLGPE
ncbi:MAG: exosortase/archaeosortase family protein [Gemmatales bacterium]|nr:exosortase/archaeosortase family protein [Gemmatales bacterium]MDW8387209.1 exosortase/archaeosortase family protein [Gemmatales bacterium]